MGLPRLPHLLGIEGLSPETISGLLDLSENYIDQNRSFDKRRDMLAGRTVINLFFENSTRTRTSFEVAAKRLGADVINMDVATSSVRKGETLLDTAMTLNAMRPDAIVVRHSESGAVNLLSQKVNCTVINAGDGQHEHPTQALLDALTIRRRLGRIDGVTVAICGDIRHSRVANSNMKALVLLGADVRVVAPPALMPDDPLPGIVGYDSLDAGIAGADVVMMLRIQRERMEEAVAGSLGDFHAAYGLTRARLDAHAPGAIVMHPGPMNRGVEIDGELADDPVRSAILEQVELGVAVRMACLDLLTRERRA